MSFYRIYRPQTLEEIDNEVVREKLTSLLHKDRSDLPHAFLFSGPKGTGKTTAARMVAKLFNCEKLSRRDGPCGSCLSCTSIARGNNLDVLEMDAASNRGIEDIRSLRDQIALAPAHATFKVYIIDEVHMLTTEAFNALLKTLEEPPPHAVFVLATTDVHKVPATIVSRCMQIVFARAGADELVHALGRIVKKEKIDIDKEALQTIAEVSDGSFRDATKILEQVSFHRGKVTPAVIAKTLSLSSQSIRDALIRHMAKRDVKAGLDVVATLVSDGHDMRSFLADCLEEFSRMLVSHVLGKPSAGWDEDGLKHAIHILSESYVMLKSTPVASLPLELAVVELCAVGQERELHDGTADRKAATHDAKEPRVEKRQGKDSMESEEAQPPAGGVDPGVTGLLTLEKLTEHWPDFIDSLKSYNHSIAGVLRSSRPKHVKNGIVGIEAFYKFHAEKLGEARTREVLGATLKKLFGENVKVEIILGKK